MTRDKQGRFTDNGWKAKREAMTHELACECAERDIERAIIEAMERDEWR